MLNVGIIGYGYWGPNLVRNFNATGACNVHSVAEMNAQRHDAIKKNAPSVNIVLTGDEIINNLEIDAVVIATPINTHFDLAKKALEAGKHVLIEKPMATSIAECNELIEIANNKKLSLMVDHTFLYTGAVRKIKTLVESGELGQLQYFDSQRINLGLFNPAWSVMWDLAVHDVSILDFINGGKKPIGVSATGIAHTQMGIEDISYVTIFYPDDMIAHISSSWISPVKVRKTLIGGSKKMVVYDDVEPSEKIKIYDHGFEVKTKEELHKLYIDYRFGDISIPKLEQTEALLGVAKDFISSILNGTMPTANAQNGATVVSILEAAQKSMQQRGAEIKLN